MTNPKSIKRSQRRDLFGSLGLFLVIALLSLTLVACGAVTPGSATTNPTATGAAAGSTWATASSDTTTAASANSATTATNASNASASSGAATATSGSATVAQAVPAPTTAPAATGNQATSPDLKESNTVVGVVKQVSPAVVTVYNKANAGTGFGRTNPNNPGGNNTNPNTNPGSRTQGIGSGVIISDQGYIVTNAHVVEGQQGLTVAFNNGKQVVEAKLVGSDTDGDIAVLKVDGPVPAVAKFGDSSRLEIGQTVIAIGSALGDFRNSVTKGIVSGLNRTIDNQPSVYIQTDTAINHGNSGGPLLNLQGEIIGINTAVLRSSPSSVGVGGDVAEGLGFAIPSNLVKNLSDQLISKGSVARPYFGITYQMITPALAGSTIGGTSIPAVEGAWISGSSRSGSGVVSGSPADKAGLKNNDVITAINDEPLNDNNPLVNAVLKYKPGDTVKLTVQRGNQTVTLNLTLGERPKNLNN